VTHEEGEALGGGELGGHDEVGLVLAVVIVRDDDELAATQGTQCVGEACFARCILSLLGGPRAERRLVRRRAHVRNGKAKTGFCQRQR
jgi:hypothetical protein